MIARLLAAAAAAAAVTGAVLMRSWDRSAGLKVAELDRARTADQWKAEERTAELESDLDESRALRARLDAKLRAKRVELAGLRGEHADLLRRYATAETERASALEGRRVLALETSGTADAKALPAAGSTPTLEAYRRAAQALRDLPRNAAAQQARRTAEAARARDLAERARETEEPAGEARGGRRNRAHPYGRHRSRAPAGRAGPGRLHRPPGGAGRGGDRAVRGPQARPAPRGRLRLLRYAEGRGRHRGRAEQRPRRRRGRGGPRRGPGLRDPAAHPGRRPRRLPLAPHVPAAPRAVGQVIDLTAHDETEQLDVAELRGAVNS
ncbi:hypothetical protein STANM309S_01784 [Streptomyces tanashiensis]